MKPVKTFGSKPISWMYKPSAYRIKSKTLYLQMINSKDSVVWQEKYPIENGIVSGHVYIDEKLSEGDYFLEGYTKHSFYKNDTIGITPTRKIRIVKNIARSEVTESLKDTVFRFETFPEGGNLVSGLFSKLAFKATDGKGNPVAVEGAIYEDDKFLCGIKKRARWNGGCFLHSLSE